jgi:hypothetical protein
LVGARAVSIDAVASLAVIEPTMKPAIDQPTLQDNEHIE